MTTVRFSRQNSVFEIYIDLRPHGIPNTDTRFSVLLGHKTISSSHDVSTSRVEDMYKGEEFTLETSVVVV